MALFHQHRSVPILLRRSIKCSCCSMFWSAISGQDGMRGSTGQAPKRVLWDATPVRPVIVDVSGKRNSAVTRQPVELRIGPVPSECARRVIHDCPGTLIPILRSSAWLVSVTLERP